jgi:WD40 repeat protein/tetratricopeptide (TPR) repeat protein
MSSSACVPQVGQLPESPYPGIDPYSYADREVYSGRESEARDLLRLVAIYRGVLLYANSGIGKSSLINAGLIPLALSEGYQPQRVRVQPRQGQEIVIERLSENKRGTPCLLPSLFVSDDTTERVSMSIEVLLQKLREKAAQARPLLLFDQFEEWVTLFEEGSAGQTTEQVRAAQGRICQAIAAILRETTLPVKILISLREDYLAKLTPLFRMCPSLPDQYLRLVPLEGGEIARVIRQPFATHPQHYSREIDDNLAQRIQQEFVSRGSTRDVPLTEVQIVCRSLFESGVATDGLATFFEQHGGVQGLLERYLEQSLASLGEEQREPAICLLTRMLTSAGTRNVIWEGDLVGRVVNEDGIPRELVTKTLNNLEQSTKLVRRESRRDVYYYEIASEFLVGWIRNTALEHEKRAEQRKLEKQRLEQAARERQAKAQLRVEKQARNKRRLVIALSLIVAVVAILATAALRMESVKAKEARTAESLRLAQSAGLVTGDPEVRFLLAMKAASEIFPEDRHLLPDTEAALDQSLREPQFTCTLHGVIDGLTDLSFSPDGKRLVTVENSRTPRIWDARYGTLLLTLTGHTDNATKAVFDPTGKYVATASEDLTIRIWDASSGQSMRTIPVGFQVWGIAFSNDSRLLAAVGDDTLIRAWDLSGSLQKLSEKQIADQFGFIRAVDWNITDTEKSSLLRDRTGEIVYSTPDPDIVARAFSPDGQYLATAKRDNSLTVRNAKAKLWNGPSRQTTVTQLTFSPNGTAMAVGNEDGTIEIEGTGSTFHKLEGHKRSVMNLAFSQDGNHLASWSTDRTVKVWSAPPTLADLDYSPLLTFSGDTSRIAGTDSDHAILVWDSASLNGVSKLPNSSELSQLILSFDGRRIAAVSGEKSPGKFAPQLPDKAGETATASIRIWDLASAEIPPVEVAARDVEALAFNRDGAQLLTVGKDNIVKSWDSRSGKPVSSQSGPQGEFLSIVLSADGSRLVGFRKIGEVVVFNTANGTTSFSAPVNPDVHPSLSPDGSIIAAAARDNSLISLWDPNGHLLRQLTTDTSNISTLIFSPNGARLSIIRGDDEGTIEVWNTVTGQQLHSFSAGRTQISGSTMAFPRRDSFVLVGRRGAWESYDIDVAALMDRAREQKRASRPLTSQECHKYRLAGVECQVADLMDHGFKLVQAGDVKTAESEFQRAQSLDQNYPEAEIRRLSAENILADAKASALSGDLERTTATFRKAAQVDPGAKIDPEVEARHWVARGHIQDAQRLAAQIPTAGPQDAPGLWEKATVAYHNALAGDPALKVTAEAWNTMCWYGSVTGHARDALDYCEKAVSAAPDDSNFRDSRGLARALTNNFPGAIEDFQAFIDKGEMPATSAKRLQRIKSKRKVWIKVLSNHQNPFPPTALAGLMTE